MPPFFILNFATVEAVQWIYDKVVGLGFSVTTGHIKGNPIDQILIRETDWDTIGSKDGIHSDMPTITISIFRKTNKECITVFNTIRPVIAADLANGIRGAKIVDRDSGYHNENEMYILNIEVDIRTNL